ncbi:hypothetical protein AAE02nite_21470 [Adhaeribacter aerolatus]|uniref:CD-NTase-associated protein 12/Pycsar effector protein TIR domain-containing protein n=2 Tax=Adhaeribacter aerolatus TaxID=670289 RepID=A0A512AXP5_9BACT|nr:hypothetical protein AAE02nite_21470 [Adhaeribacter aerolatus]
MAYAAQENLEHQFEVTVWNQGLFDISQYILDGLLEALDEFDFGLFVFSPDDITRIRNVEHRTVRDNVLFELGLFIGRLGRDRNFILMPRDISNLYLPTDLLGIIPATFEPNRQDGNLNAALGPACSKICKAAARIRPRQTSPYEITVDEDEIDDNDIISIIETWMGSRSSNSNRQAIRYTDVDEELSLPPGSAIKFIEKAADKWGYFPARKGKQTIVFGHRGDLELDIDDII